MPERWNEYFFMIGSSAAALIGLMFVVATLTAGRDRKQLEAGKTLYTTPIVWHLAVILLVSAAAIAPAITPRSLGLGCFAISLAGTAYGVRIATGILRARVASNFSSYDALWYGVVPTIAYLAIGASGLGMLVARPWSNGATAASMMLLLLVSIHNEWDLVTFLAPDAQPTSGGENTRSPSDM